MRPGWGQWWMCHFTIAMPPQSMQRSAVSAFPWYISAVDCFRGFGTLVLVRWPLPPACFTWYPTKDKWQDRNKCREREGEREIETERERERESERERERQGRCAPLPSCRSHLIRPGDLHPGHEWQPKFSNAITGRDGKLVSPPDRSPCCPW